MALVPFGRFGRAHGVRGELRFWPHNPQSPLLAAGREIQVGRNPDHLTAHTVEQVRFDPRGVVVRLGGVADREAADALRGADWFEDRAAFAPLDDPDEVYCADLVGLTARTDAGRDLGRVVDVMTNGATDILVIRGAGREHLVPFVEAFVARVDVAAGELIIVPAEGLLDD